MSPGQPMSVLVKGNTLLITGCPSLGATFEFRDFSKLFRDSDTPYRRVQYNGPLPLGRGAAVVHFLQLT